ncbi:polyketide cyclase/dehydrase/lipid transport protein [Ilumatobacter fluminis]|uniref:Polyketide cyclase/dehydrase/lipid transport protein n=2 Tax=Ilumatobacter fluminis TaxID=467091 RepID=A0A4R7HYY4_9ACTN|nr:polyketide cyclase/dehydrase/lipid transport protein [Ilumatobacter fluminis]
MQTMAETATESITIAAPLDKVWEIATDLENYPTWTHDVKEVVITNRDDEGRPHEVEFRTSALGRSTHYTLEYDYTSAPKKLAWSMVKGDIQRSIDGAFTFQSTDDGNTHVQYDLAIELVVPLPGFVKRRAERRILNAIKELKTFAEA